jgi:hypothetical protein
VLARVALFCVLLVKKTAPTKVLRHPVARLLEHRSDVAGRQVAPRVERELVSITKYPIEEHRVHVRVELQVRRRPLDRHHRAALPRRATAALSVEPEHRLDEQACQR